MPSKMIRTLSALELEERLLNAGALISMLSVFLPWIGGDWSGGDRVWYSGFGFYTSFLGLSIFLPAFLPTSADAGPLLGGPRS